MNDEEGDTALGSEHFLSLPFHRPAIKVKKNQINAHGRSKRLAEGELAQTS